ncbi:hypothetical protein SSYRP_v1c07080 [Spiroplasma syrphidicola EA-1]|uniref:DUF7226 domain-containing protein n=1 Tax=Spiroplasma syrphidicola EA-1 TaxID=1276229 RepID=R4U6Q1_9MOLU|nr:hypothetical protein [Spiroplasma syrphidicola]AGM26298.1 hypothetical protein SSYRP_v1c07080 [Spiroplasma syrphidicola EA-1]
MKKEIVYKVENNKTIIPQADKLESLYNILVAIEIRPLFYHDIADDIEDLKDKRQWDYYASSLYFLGVANKWIYNKHKFIFINELGSDILKSSDSKRSFINLAKKKLVEYDLFNLDENYLADKLENKYKLSGETISRRIQTIKAWIKIINEI